MLEELDGDIHGKVEWRRLLHLDAKATVVIVGGALFLLGLLVGLPRWLRAQDRADFAGSPVQTAPGTVEMLQISPVSQGGGGLFNAVTLSFGKRQVYYALPPDSRWRPKRGENVTVSYQVGRRSGLVHVDAVVPRPGP